jgi:mono/diheme cytochrome c family protein
MTPHRFALFLVIVGFTTLAACSDTSQKSTIQNIAGGDPEQGRSLIHAYGCGTCHTIQGIRGARGKVGPELQDYAQQHLLAGFLPNSPPYLIAWLMDPVALKSTTGMPSQGVSEAEARHIASYLYTLGGNAQVYPPDPQLPLSGQHDPGIAISVPDTGSSDIVPRTRRIIPKPD